MSTDTTQVIMHVHVQKNCSSDFKICQLYTQTAQFYTSSDTALTSNA